MRGRCRGRLERVHFRSFGASRRSPARNDKRPASDVCLSGAKLVRSPGSRRPSVAQAVNARGGFVSSAMRSFFLARMYIGPMDPSGSPVWELTS